MNSSMRTVIERQHHTKRGGDGLEGSANGCSVDDKISLQQEGLDMVAENGFVVRLTDYVHIFGDNRRCLITCLAARRCAVANPSRRLIDVLRD